LTRGQCYNLIFWQFLPIFGKEIQKTNVTIQFLRKLVCILNKKGPILCENIFKIMASLPGCLNQPIVVPSESSRKKVDKKSRGKFDQSSSFILADAILFFQLRRKFFFLPKISIWWNKSWDWKKTGNRLQIKHMSGSGVARWFIFKPKIPVWVNFGVP
jgi:hypothetical protein